MKMRFTTVVLSLLTTTAAWAIIPGEPNQLPAPEMLPLFVIGGVIGLALYLKRRK